jgi:hypothetical protein
MQYRQPPSLFSANLPSATQARFEAGLLTCEVEAGVAFIMSSPRDLHCVFHKSDGLNEAYGGTLQSVGAEIGVSGRGVIAWTVIAETRELPPGVLAGEFGGVEAGGAAVVGGRGQALVGGSRRTITLQPVSVEAEVELNLAIGVTSMELRPLFRGRHSERAGRGFFARSGAGSSPDAALRLRVLRPSATRADPLRHHS